MTKKKELTSAAALLGSKGGSKSSANMTAQERSERGKKAVMARWAKKEKEEEGKK